MTAQQNPYLIGVRLNTGMLVLYIVLGSLLFLAGLLTLLLGAFSIYLILGPIFLAMGIMSFRNPMYRYDTATGTLEMLNSFGYRARTYGAPKGERIYFDPVKSKIMRARANGSQRKVNTFGTNRDELARLIAALPQHQA